MICKLIAPPAVMEHLKKSQKLCDIVSRLHANLVLIVEKSGPEKVVKLTCLAEQTIGGKETPKQVLLHQYICTKEIFKNIIYVVLQWCQNDCQLLVCLSESHTSALVCDDRVGTHTGTTLAWIYKEVICACSTGCSSAFACFLSLAWYVMVLSLNVLQSLGNSTSPT